MKVQRIFSFAKKDLKLIIREPGSLFLVILFPVVNRKNPPSKPMGPWQRLGNSWMSWLRNKSLKH